MPQGEIEGNSMSARPWTLCSLEWPPPGDIEIKDEHGEHECFRDADRIYDNSGNMMYDLWTAYPSGASWRRAKEEIR